MVAGKRWTEEEDAVVREFYPRGGNAAVDRLSHRSAMAIRTRAGFLGVKIAPGCRKKSLFPGPGVVAKMGLLMRYIIDYKRKNDGLSPSMREICRALSFSSTSIVSHLLVRLEGDGRIRRRMRGRIMWGIVVVGGKWTYEDE